MNSRRVARRAAASCGKVKALTYRRWRPRQPDTADARRRREAVIADRAGSGATERRATVAGWREWAGCWRLRQPTKVWRSPVPDVRPTNGRAADRHHRAADRPIELRRSALSQRENRPGRPNSSAETLAWLKRFSSFAHDRQPPVSAASAGERMILGGVALGAGPDSLGRVGPKARAPRQNVASSLALNPLSLALDARTPE